MLTSSALAMALFLLSASCFVSQVVGQHQAVSVLRCMPTARCDVSPSFGLSELRRPCRDSAHSRQPPGDEQLREVLAQVRLSPLLQRCSQASSNGSGAPAAGLDCQADWAAMLSLGEQQRLAFGR